MSLEAWNAFVVEFQQYLLVFDTPTRHFLYALAIGATILSVIFSYYMTKITLEFGVNVLQAVFGLLKLMADTFVNSLKTIFDRQPKTPVRYYGYESQVESPAEMSIEG